ncbi:DUF2231 domain-containing protein [Fodinicola acaciae]|uniref:DUF2231 domain-containing protein n=1 Tax=Fodinicola acaciae TaxID=2681555 RepID=UPI0013D22FAF|nr:DUF2231 domain-containing protein [Fodinicola acaciae]
MPTFISGLPLHVLVVHAVVVFVPLAALSAAVCAVWPAARRRYGWLAVAVTFVATAAIPIATNSGEALRDRLPRDPLIGAHAELGDQMLVYVAPLLVLLAGLVTVELLRTRAITDAGDATNRVQVRWMRPATIGLAALVVLFAVLSCVQVVRVGDSGARAAWSDTQYTAPSDRGQRD